MVRQEDGYGKRTADEVGRACRGERPNEGALEMMRQATATAGVSLAVLPDHLGGFLRLRPA